MTAPAEQDPVHIRVRDLKKSYGDAHILRGMSFDVMRAGINILIGGSGAGKSVTMRHLIRLEEPDGGTIEVDGVDIAHLGERELIPIRKNFGMVFQMSALFDSMDVYDNVAFPLREHTKMGRKEIHERVMDRLQALGLEHALHRATDQISGGMAKRVALARALVMEPKILIYDEPTTGLDPVTSRSVDDLIQTTAEQYGVTSIVISHDMASVFRTADHISFLHLGQIAISGTPQYILESDNEVVRNFLEASGVDPEALDV